MLVEIITQQQESIEIEIPCFVKYGEHYYKINSQKEVVNVSLYDFCTSVEHTNEGHCNPFRNNGWEFITEQDFNKALETAMNRLRNLQPACQL